MAPLPYCIISILEINRLGDQSSKQSPSGLKLLDISFVISHNCLIAAL